MIKQKLLFSLFCLVMFTLTIQADVAPEPNMMRVYPQLIFDLTEDFTDYRFFLESPIDVEEIKVKKGETKNIDNANRGGAKRRVSLIAIPQTEIDRLGFSKNVNADLAKELKEVLNKKEINGVVELLNHSFQQDIPISERATWTYPTYLIERDGETLKAVRSGEISPKMSLEEEKEMNQGKFQFALIIVGIMIAFTIIVFGIVLVRKVLEKG